MIKIMFLDESGDHSLDKIDNSYPMFVLVGCIFDLDYYSEAIEPKVNELKLKHFGKTDIILRSYDIGKQKRDFSCLVDKKKREIFYNDLNDLIKSIDFKIISAAIHKSKLKYQNNNSDNPYNICFQFILKESIKFLDKTNEKLIFRIESREKHNDKKLIEIYQDFKLNDCEIVNKKEIASKFTDLSFNQKIHNIAGQQIADLVAYPIGVFALDDKRENKSFEIIKTKLYTASEDCMNFGLKIFP